MDAARFEILLRSLATAPSRRTFLAGLVSSLLASLSPAVTGRDQGVGVRAKGKRRRADHHDRVHDEKKKKKKRKKKPSPLSPPSPTCTQTCAGCCNGDTCEAGTSAAACGSGGGACAVCSDPHYLCLNSACRCDVCASGCPYATVQAAVADGAGPSIIRICAGTYTEAITIDRDVRLIGAGDGAGAGDTILHGTGTNSVMTINTGRIVMLERLRITGGNRSFGVAGGINSAGTVTLTHCTVTGNHAEAGGGGGIVNAGRLTLDASHVTNNDAGVGTGGASGGGGIYNVHFGSCRVTLKNGSTVAGNTATGSGGGVVNDSGCTLTLLSGSSITDNDATSGAGIHNSGTLTLIESAVAHNSATTSGGGIYNNTGGTVTLLEGSTITGNDAPSGGGILNFSGGVVNLVDGSIASNNPDNCATAAALVALGRRSAWTPLATGDHRCRRTRARDPGSGFWPRQRRHL